MDDSRVTLTIVATLLAVVLAAGLDLALDQPQTLLSVHVLVELTVLVTSLTLALYLWRAWFLTRTKLVSSRESLAESVRELEDWRDASSDSMRDFSVAVANQMRSWGLTPAEREVAVEVLKGISHKQIAARTNRSERTVRQHAVSIYSKSGLGGRAELAGFFLNELAVISAEGDPKIPSEV
jgi:DNA-binding CsgD family transcriptional regulator